MKYLIISLFMIGFLSSCSLILEEPFENMAIDIKNYHESMLEASETQQE